MSTVAVERESLRNAPNKGVAEAVREILSVPDAELDYARSKLALDALVDPSLDADWAMGELDRMAEAAHRMAGPGATADRKIAALRRLIYASGPWNDHRPFAYDHDNVRGADVRVKLIASYLTTRRGDCVSMPALFLILADKLDVEIALVSAPFHLFVRYTDDRGRQVNLETTSGANPARDEWIRTVRETTDRAIESGLYLRTLPKREGIAYLACVAIQHLRDAGHYEEMIAVADVVLEHAPRDALTLINRSGACDRILRRDFLDIYGTQFLVPAHLQPRYQMLWARNHADFARATALGWTPDIG